MLLHIFLKISKLTTLCGSAIETLTAIGVKKNEICRHVSSTISLEFLKIINRNVIEIVDLLFSVEDENPDDPILFMKTELIEWHQDFTEFFATFQPDHASYGFDWLKNFSVFGIISVFKLNLDTLIDDHF